MERRRFVQIVCITAALAIVFILARAGLTQVRKPRIRSSVRNTYGGYDFYTPSGNKSGYSRPNRKGEYYYYDNAGNLLGRLKLKNKSKRIYDYYDAEGVKRGVLRKRASGIYYYRDVESNSIIDSIPEHEGELGSMSPQTFQGKE